LPVPPPFPFHTLITNACPGMSAPLFCWSEPHLNLNILPGLPISDPHLSPSPSSQSNLNSGWWWRWCGM
jgi:hypothetical protein